MTASRWEQICEAVQARIAAVVTNCQFGFGSNAIDEHRAPTTVYFVPAGGAITPVNEIGGRPDPSDANNLKKQIFYASQNIDVYCWSTTKANTEQLFHDCVVAIWEECYGSTLFGDFSWLTEEEKENSGFDLLGHIIRFQFTVHIPIIRELQPLTDIEMVDHVSIDEDFEVTCATFNVYGFGLTYGQPGLNYAP